MPPRPPSSTLFPYTTLFRSLKGSALSQRMRIGGTVAVGSIRHLAGRVDFVLEGEGKTLPVSYIGTDPLPDTFVDKSQALVEGRPGPEGRFVAEVVQAKCAAKYDAAPGGKGGAAPSPTEKSGM